MKPRNRSTGLMALLTTVLLTGSSSIAPISFQPESRLWVDGTSNVRSYTCKATGLQGSVTAAGEDAGLAIAGLQGAVRTAKVSVPVQSLDCANGTMNAHLRNALKMQANPTITFVLSDYEVVPGGATEGTARLKGTLAIAGQERPVSIDASLDTDAGGALRVKGSKEVLMTDFGVRPPTLMLGTLKVHDRVVVHFDVVLKQS